MNKKTKLLSIVLTLLLAVHSFAANRYWLGAADDVKQVTTITVADTWATGDTATVICNNKTVTVTVGTDSAVADVAAALAAAINAFNSTDGLVNDETINRGGQELGEFRDMVASSSSAVLTLTSATAGVPFTVTVDETTAGDGTLGSPSEVTAATGKNWFNNADNWSGSLSAGDSLIFANSSVSVLYGLGNSTLDFTLIRKNTYTGDIGLREINTTHSGYPYREYQVNRYLVLPITTTTGQVSHEIGESLVDDTPTGITKIDLGTNTGSDLLCTVYDAPAYTTADRYAVEIVGGKKLELLVHKGSVSAGENINQNATELDQLYVEYKTSVATDAKVLIGANATWKSTPQKMVIAGGEVRLDATGTDLDIDQHAGTVYVDAPILSDVVLFGGTLTGNAVSSTNLTVHSGATFDASQSSVSTMSNVFLYKGATYKDPRGIVVTTNGLDLIGCDLDDVTLDVKASQTWTPSSL